MAAYIVMEPPGADRTDATDRAVFVRDGFHWFAFLAPPLWLLWQKLWIEAAIAFAAGVALTALGETAGLGSVGAGLSLMVALYVGIEGAALKLGALRRRGWSEWGVVEADNSAEAEIRYLAEEGEGPATPHFAQPVQATTRPAPFGPALGLFHYPGKP